MSAPSAERRRQAVLRVLQGRAISTQEQLLEALRHEGFRATQATLSRDLARLGVRRASRPGGGAVYEIGDGPLEPGIALAGLVASVATNGSTVVVRTRPGSAPAVARAIDVAALPEVLGTIAGDDTIFVAPAHERRVRALATRLGTMFGVPPVRAAGPGRRRLPPRSSGAGATAPAAPGRS